MGLRVDFQVGLFVGLGASLVIGLYFVQLWLGERQILRHTENLFHRVEQKNWSGVANLIADDYADQWGNALFSERVPQFFLGRFHFALGLIAKQKCAQFVALIITRQKFSLGVGAAQIDPSRLHAKIPDKVEP